MSAYVELLKSTRAEIVNLLKRRGDLTASELAGALRISAVAVRRHLDQLEQQVLVRHAARPSEPCERGRPQHVYSLTEQGDGLFPDRSARFACDLLGQVEQAFGGEALRALLATQTDVTIAALREELRGLDFEERVRALAARFNDLGFVTEVLPVGDGSFRVIEHNCPTRGVAERFPVVCEEELRVYEEVAGARVYRDCRIAEGGKTCEYRLEPDAGAASSRRLPVLRAAGPGGNGRG